MFARYTSSIIFTVLLLGLASRASALSILGVNVNQPFDYMAAVNGGHCVDAHGLACGWQSKDPLIDPTTGLVANPLPSGQVESPVWTRDAIYTATGIDPSPSVAAAIRTKRDRHPRRRHRWWNRRLPRLLELVREPDTRLPDRQARH